MLGVIKVASSSKICINCILTLFCTGSFINFPYFVLKLSMMNMASGIKNKISEPKI